MQFSKIVVGVVGVCIGFCALQPVVHAQDRVRADGGEIAAPELQRRVEEVWRKHGLKLIDENPDILGAAPSPATGEIILETDRPALMPKTIEGIPTKVVVIEVAPPPPGVVLLLPEGKYEIRNDLQACPQGFKEYEQLRWRWCQPARGQMQPFPLHLTDADPGVAGVPLEVAEEILDRHRDELMALPGVNKVGLSKKGVRVGTDKPELVPNDIEGLPVIILPRKTAVHGFDIPGNWWDQRRKLNSR